MARHSHCCISCLLTILAVIFLSLPAKAAERIALLIGNQGYQTLNPLGNSHNDVDLVRQSLESLGFKVTVVKDGSLQDSQYAIDRHVDQLTAAGTGAVGFFYYSGHGGADRITKTQYLIPVDMTPVDFWAGAIDGDAFVAQLSIRAPNASHYVVFDTDRAEYEGKPPPKKAPNPAQSRAPPDMSISSGAKKGFVPVERTGVLVAYATAPGFHSSEGSGRGGPYARALAQEISRPGIEAITMFRNVQSEVIKEAEQRPWLSFGPMPDVFLAGKEVEKIEPMGPRLALLIGNKKYTQAVGPLVNPHNDVKLVGDALKKVGFELLPPVFDGSREQMMLAVLDFAEKLKAAGPDAVGLFYYAGHGVALGTQNYMIPVDVQQPSSRLLTVSGLPLSDVLGKLQEIAPEAAHYLVFDACRNNLGGSRGSRGFVPEQRRSGVMIAFASAPGTVASDEGEKAGPYAAALASELTRPSQIDLVMFHNVRVKVDTVSNGDQVPWVEDGIRRPKRMSFAGAK